MGWNCPGCTMEIPLNKPAAIRRHEASCEGLAEMRAAEQQRKAELDAALRAAVAEEREACLQAIREADDANVGNPHAALGLEIAMNAIRARGK